MFIPISNGKTITPVYIPQPTISHNTTQVSNLDNNEVTQSNEIAVIDTFFIILIFIIIISTLIYFIRLLKELIK